MGTAIIAVVDTILLLMGRVNAGLDAAKTFYDAIRTNNPQDNLPELSDAELILRMRGVFTANREQAEAELKRLDEMAAAVAAALGGTPTPVIDDPLAPPALPAPTL